MFEPVGRRPSAVEATAASLRRGLLRGEIAAGSRLPPERDLAVTLGVNRTTLRAALHELAADGLLDVRQGSGHVVRDLGAHGGPELVPALIELARAEGRLREVCAELLRVRRALAGALLEATDAPDAAALDGVAAAIDALEGAIADGPAAIAEADLRVVRAWARCARSPVLGWFAQPIARLLAGLPELRDAMYADPPDNVRAWRALLAAVRAGALDAGALRSVLAARDAATLERL